MRAYRIRRYGDKRRHENWKIEDRGKKRWDETSQAEIGRHRREDRRLDEKRKRQETQNGTEMTIRRERGQDWSETRQVQNRDDIKCKREETRWGQRYERQRYKMRWDETEDNLRRQRWDETEEEAVRRTRLWHCHRSTTLYTTFSLGTQVMYSS